MFLWTKLFWYLRHRFGRRHVSVWSYIKVRYVCRCGEEWPCRANSRVRDYRWYEGDWRRW